MVDRFGVERLHEAEFIGQLGCVRQQLANRRLRLAMLIELEDRAGKWQPSLVGRHPRKPLPLANTLRQIFPILLIEQWLMITVCDIFRPASAA